MLFSYFQTGPKMQTQAGEMESNRFKWWYCSGSQGRQVRGWGPMACLEAGGKAMVWRQDDEHFFQYIMEQRGLEIQSKAYINNK